MLEASLITGTAQIAGHLFIQNLLKRPLDRRQSLVVDLPMDLVLDIAGECATMHNLHVVSKVASVVKLRCMAYRDILL
jgi:hypothetical protein